MTSTKSSRVMLARSTAWAPIASVSTSASWSYASVPERWSFRAGTAICGRMPPSMCTPSTLRSAQQFDLPAAARKTAPAIDVRLDRATVAGLEPVRVAAGVEDLDAELVTEDARVVEKRLPSSEGVEVGAADADAMHAHQRFARLARDGAGPSVATK